MGEYTLVFRRAVTSNGRAPSDGARRWVVTRPAGAPPDDDTAHELRSFAGQSMAQVFAVPICSALGMDAAAYERFLLDSGALQGALAVLGNSALTRPSAVITARKEIQSLVMAAEVQHIIARLSA